MSHVLIIPTTLVCLFLALPSLPHSRFKYYIFFFYNNIIAYLTSVDSTDQWRVLYIMHGRVITPNHRLQTEYGHMIEMLCKL